MEGIPDVILVDLVYVLAMGWVVWTALTHLRCQRTIVCFTRVSVQFAVVACVAALSGSALTVWSPFTVFRFVAYAVFLHGVVLLSGAGILLRRTSRTVAVALALAAIALAAIGVDAFFVEPEWLDVSHVRLTSPKLDEPLRIAVIADLQTDKFGRYERRVFHCAMAEEPDLILLAGDYLQVGRSRYDSLRHELNAYLRQIDFRADRGVFAVRGNVDPDGWPRLFEGLPVTAVTSTKSFDVGELRVTCLKDRRSFSPRLCITNSDPTRYHVVLGHSPNFALGDIQADLLVAGHTHGGQVRLPWLGPLMTASLLPRRWAAGVSTLPSGATLVVSRGIGLERIAAPRMRFLCRPELVVIDVLPENGTDKK
jgi:predicted MPP superfamily phosphohydrolase